MSEAATKTKQADTPGRESNLVTAGPAGWGRLIAWENQFTDLFLHGPALTDPEQGRRGRLITRFGFLGFLFGLVFATFYFSIGHRWGAVIVTLCSLGFGLAPLLMKALRSQDFAGNLLVGLMTAGFTALCFVEGGLSGHAIAWLAIVPLCALLLAGKHAAQKWLIICFLALGTVVGLALAGVNLPVTYPARWEPIVSASGYLALIVFMFCLGMIFEKGRERAFNKMQDALARLESSNAELVNLNNEKNEFMGIAAHDLKNPLTTIILGAEVMQGTNPAAHHQSIIQGIERAGTRMRELITQLLDANAIETGHYSSKIERCDLAALAALCASHHQAAAERKQIKIELSLPAEIPARADRNGVVQILDNLISNAVKYSPHRTTVKVHGLVERGLACVSVTDQGPGISEDDQKKLFGKFTRLSARPTGGESSSGLGLSIVKKLAEIMAGRVDCRSILGEGATFTVRLPVWNGAAASVADKPAKAPTQS